MMYDPYAHNDDDGKDHPDDLYEDQLARAEALAANYLADDCTERCGICDTRVLDDGRCPDCDNASDFDDDVSANTFGDIDR